MKKPASNASGFGRFFDNLISLRSLLSLASVAVADGASCIRGVLLRRVELSVFRCLALLRRDAHIPKNLASGLSNFPFLGQSRES